MNRSAFGSVESLRMAKIAYALKIEGWKENAHNLKQDFADKAYWRKLASKFQVRFPSDFVPGTEFKAARKAMRKCGVTPDQIRDSFGGDVRHIHTCNPNWPLFAIIGLILEIAEENT